MIDITKPNKNIEMGRYKQPEKIAWKFF